MLYNSFSINMEPVFWFFFKISAVFFSSSIFGHQNPGSGLDLDPDWIWIRIGSGSGLDLDPDWIWIRIKSGSGLDLDPDWIWIRICIWIQYIQIHSTGKIYEKNYLWAGVASRGCTAWQSSAVLVQAGPVKQAVTRQPESDQSFI